MLEGVKSQVELIEINVPGVGAPSRPLLKRLIPVYTVDGKAVECLRVSIALQSAASGSTQQQITEYLHYKKTLPLDVQSF